MPKEREDSTDKRTAVNEISHQFDTCGDVCAKVVKQRSIHDEQGDLEKFTLPVFS